MRSVVTGFAAMSWSEISWTENFRKAKVQADANCIALNFWASRSLVVVDQGRNLTPHDPDRPTRNAAG